MPGEKELTNHIPQHQRKSETDQPRTCEEEFHRLMELSFDAIIIHCEGKVVFANPAGAEIIGAETPEQLIGKPMLDFVHPDYRGTVKERVQKAIGEGKRAPLAEEKLVRLNGEEIDVEVTGIPTTYNGKPAVRVVLRDITERKRAEEALRKSEHEKAIILDSISELVAYQDAEMRVLWVNRAASESVGLAAEQLIGRHCYEIWNQRHEPCVDCPVLRARETGQPQETEVTTPDGRIWFIRGYPVRDENDNIIGAVEVALEITKRKRAENLMRVQRDLGLALGAAPGFDETLRLCTEAAIRASGMDGGGIYLVDETTGNLDLAFHTGLSPEFIERASHYDASSANAQLVMSGEPVYTRYQDLGVPLNDVNRRERLRAIAVIPIRYEDQIVACLNIASYTLDEVPDFARDALETIASQIGSAIINARVEQALRASRAKLQTLFDSLEDFLFVLDLEGRMLRVNPLVLERLGYSEEELLGKHVLSVHPPDRREEAQAAVADIVAGKTEWSSIPLMAKDGTRIPVETKVTRGRWNAQQVLIGVSRDITRRMQMEEDLRIKENAIASSITAMAIAEFAGNLTYVNPAFLGMWGYEDESEVLGKPAAEFWQMEEQAGEVIEALRNGDSWSGELVAKRKDGSLFDVLLSASMVTEETGRPICMMGSFMDITERKRAEEDLRRARREWEEIFQAIGQPALILDPHHHIMAANRAAVGATGKSEDELVGRKCYEIFHKAGTDRPPACCPMETALASGQSETVEMEMETLKGLFLVSCTPVIDEEGRPEKVIHIATDIAEHRRLEREIEERRSYLESILANAPYAIVTMDTHHNILEWNPGAERLFGYTQEEVVGQNIDALITGTDKDVIKEAIDLTQQAMSGKGTPPTEAVRYRKDGSPVDVMVSGSPIVLGDQVNGTIAVYTDITERKQTEKALRRHERLAAVGQLAGGIAHDFNNLLTTIMLYAQMALKKPDLSPDLANSLKTIVSESRQATDLVQQILDFSRRSPIETHPVDLQPFIKEAFRVLQRTIPESISPLLEVEVEEYAAPLTAAPPTAAPLRVNADPTRIQQVLMNLVINARDAMPEGGKLVIGLSRMDVGPDEKPPVREMIPGKWVCLSVSDTGIGIPPDVRPHIFEPFFTTKPRGRGAGLGLAQVYGIVAQHEGFIDVETEVGKGTTFRVYLPAHEVEEVEALKKKKAPSPPAGKGESILLVEDNDSIREAGQEFLESLGYRVLTASNGRMALRVYQTAERIDLLLTDVVMPEMGGKELVRELKKQEPGLKTLAITGHLLTEEQKDLEKEGILDIIYKPFDINILAEGVRRVLDTD